MDQPNQNEDRPTQDHPSGRWHIPHLIIVIVVSLAGMLVVPYVIGAFFGAMSCGYKSVSGLAD